MPRAATRPSVLKTMERRAEDRPAPRPLSWAPVRPIAPVRPAETASPAGRREAAAPSGPGTSPTTRREAAITSERGRAAQEPRAESAADAAKPAPPRKGQTGPRPAY